MAKSTAEKLPSIELGEITNFSGGPNFRDSPTELAATESYDAYNVTFDERGGVQSRLGYVKRNLVQLGAGYKSTVLAASPKLYWRLDEASGSALDVSGNGNTGIYGSSVSRGVAGALVSDSDKAAALDGTSNSLIQSAYAPFVAGSSRTFMGWAKGSGTLFGDINGGNSAEPVPVVECSVSGSTVTFATATGTSTVTWPGVWPSNTQYVFWALTYNDSSKVAELFINGVSQGTKTLSAAYANNFGFVAGAYSPGPNGGAVGVFVGPLDEYAVFESILSSATILGIYNAGVGSSSDMVINDFYSPLIGTTLTQVGKNLMRSDVASQVHTFSTADCVTFAELGGKVIVGHPVDGLWTSPDGATWTKVADPDAPATATCICTWLSKLFVGMADGTVHWSAASDPLTWSATDFNAIWTKDQKPIVALAVGSGQDIQGRPGLLVFKQDSVYRINDSGTGAYTVIDTSYGAGGPKAVVGVGARVCWIGRGGVWWWREDQASPVKGADLLRPLWNQNQISFNNENGWAAGRRLNRAYFSVSSVNSSVNDLSFEYHPDEGWVTPRSDAMTCYSVDPSENTYGGSPTSPGQVYQLDTGGMDDTDAITGYFQTRWIVPNGGFQTQLWQTRLHGRGSGTMTVRTDYESSGGSTRSFDFSTDGFLYDNGVLYDNGATYATVTFAETESFSGLGTCRQFSIRFDFTVDSTVSGRTLSMNVPQPQVGEFAIYSVEALYVPLGLS